MRTLALMVALGAGCGAQVDAKSARASASAPPTVSAPIADAAPSGTTDDLPPMASASAGIKVETPLPLWATLDHTLTLKEEAYGTLTIVAGLELPKTEPPPIITALHANCVEPIGNCEWLRDIADGRAILVCPTGNIDCNNGGAMFGGAQAKITDLVEGDLDLATRTLGVTEARSHDVLFGSSGGAFMARNLINAGRTRWQGLVLVGAKVQLDVAATRRAGIRHVLLGAPDGDAAAPAMRAEQKRLCRAGIPARFVRLGPHGHGMEDGARPILRAQMDWVMGLAAEDETECRPSDGSK